MQKTTKHDVLILAGFAGLVLLSLSARAMTFAELQTAVDEAENGATVYVTSDMTFDRPLVLASGKTNTIASAEGQTYTITRAADYANGTFFEPAANTKQSLTVSNLVVDLACEGTKVMLNKQAVCVPVGSTFILEAGGRFCNGYQGSDKAGCLASTGGTVIMQPGSELSDLYHATYGTAAYAGGGGYFIMNGGLITRCHSIAPISTQWGDDMGGAVYVYGGFFIFNGGTITGNDSPNFTGGVVICKRYGIGNMFLGGSGAITGNVGRVSNDVLCWDSADEDIWIVNAPYTAGSKVYQGATLSVKCRKSSMTEGEVCKSFTLQTSIGSSRSEFARSDLGNVYLQDDPELALDPEGYDSSVYYTRWRRKTAVFRTADRLHTRFTLADALKSASGETGVLELWRDCVFTNDAPASWSAGTDLTLTSHGERRTIKMKDNSTTAFAFLLQPTGIEFKRLRLENIVLDGNRDGGARVPTSTLAAGTTWNHTGTIYLQRDAALELGPGTVIRNFEAEDGTCSGIHAVSLASVKMEEGAVISNMVATWASAIVLGVGYGDGKVSCPTFDMTGGLITGCRSKYSGSGLGDSGTVYLWYAIMNMSGGAITGNSAPIAGDSGLHMENGSHSVLNLSGTARICDNPGTHRDVFNRSGTIRYSGDFRGLVGICKTSPILEIAPADASATGAWCFFRSSDDPTLDRKEWGYLKSDGAVGFAAPVGWVDEWGFVEASDLDVRLSDPEDLSTPAARANLPHVLQGTALAANITQTVTFDSAALAESGELPLCLYSFGGGAFTGTHRITTPEEGKYLWWVSKQTVGGVEGLYLARNHRGMAIMVR